MIMKIKLLVFSIMMLILVSFAPVTAHHALPEPIKQDTHRKQMIFKWNNKPILTIIYQVEDKK